MKKIYITGICGMLGNNIAQELNGSYLIKGVDVAPYKISNCEIENYNILNFNQLEIRIREYMPDILIHTVAAVNVDKCETNMESAFALNVGLTKQIVEICQRYEIKLIYISTDSVFDGEKRELYNEDDKVNPINYYGVTKLLGEKEVEKCNDYLILRTNIYGTNIQEKKSFGEWILSALNNDEKIGMFTDIYFSPILVNELAQIIGKCIDNNASGVFHACGTGAITKYEFGIKMKNIFNIEKGLIEPSSSEKFNFIAKRPKNMGLDNSKLSDYLGINISTPVESIYKFKSLLDWRESK